MAPAYVSSVITTFIGFFMISFFREASKYEMHFDEMDYVIGTALHEQARLKERKKLAKLTPLAIPPISQASITTQIEAEILNMGSEHWIFQDSNPTIEDPTKEDGVIEDATMERPSIEAPVPNTVIYYPVPESDDDERHGSKAEPDGSERKVTALFRRVVKRTLVLMKLRKSSTETETMEIMDSGARMSGDKRRNTKPAMYAHELTPLMTYPRRSLIFEPESHTTPPEVLPIEKSPYQERMEMRRMFVGIDSCRLQRNSGGQRNFRFTSREWSLIKLADITKGRRNYAYDLAYYDSSRKWYQPIPAWIVVILMILLSITFIVVASVKGKFHKTASEDQFVQTFMVTIVAGILIGTFICEPMKIILIALYDAIKDKKLYKRIQKKAQQKTTSRDSQ